MTSLELLYPIFAFLFGINVGSFLNVVAYRVPRSCVTVNRPTRSFCPLCRRHLRWYENLPLVGWLSLGGRCGGCKQSISARYPLYELLTGLLWLGAAQRWLLGGAPDLAAFLVTSAVLSLLLAAALIDWDLRILPDRLILPSLALVPVACFLVPTLLPGPNLVELVERGRDSIADGLAWWGAGPALVRDVEGWALLPESFAESSYRRAFESLVASCSGLVLGVALLWSVSALGHLSFGREAMGFGDVKFAGLLGAFVGPLGIVVVFVMSCVLGGVVGLVYRFMTGRCELGRSELVELDAVSRLMLGARLRLEGLEPEARARFVGLRGLAARFATGDRSVPFGPALSIAAAFVIIAPGFTGGSLPSVLSYVTNALY